MDSCCGRVFCTSKQHCEENEQVRGGTVRAEGKTNHPDVSYIFSVACVAASVNSLICQHLDSGILNCCPPPGNGAAFHCGISSTSLFHKVFLLGRALAPRLRKFMFLFLMFLLHTRGEEARPSVQGHH